MKSVPPSDVVTVSCGCAAIVVVVVVSVVPVTFVAFVVAVVFDVTVVSVVPGTARVVGVETEGVVDRVEVVVRIAGLVVDVVLDDPPDGERPEVDVWAASWSSIADCDRWATSWGATPLATCCTAANASATATTTPSIQTLARTSPRRTH